MRDQMLEENALKLEAEELVLPYIDLFEQLRV
jgi:hypothetical protein